MSPNSDSSIPLQVVKGPVPQMKQLGKSAKSTASLNQESKRRRQNKQIQKTVGVEEESWLRGFPRGGILHLCGASNIVTDPLVFSAELSAGRKRKRGETIVAVNRETVIPAKPRKTETSSMKGLSNPAKTARPGARKIERSIQKQKKPDTLEKKIKRTISSPRPRQTIPKDQGISRDEGETIDPKQAIVNAISHLPFLTDSQKQLMIEKVKQINGSEQERVLHEQLVKFLVHEQRKYATGNQNVQQTKII